MLRLKREVSLAVATAAIVMMAGSSGALATIEASMCVNYNDPDELVITTDGDPGHKVKIMKSGDTLSKDKFKGATKELGFTGSGHRVSPWSPTGPWKPGTYTFEGKDADGNEMSTTATLSDCVSAAPEITLVSIFTPEELEEGACPNGAADITVEWGQLENPSCGDIDHYVVTMDCEGSPPFSEQVATNGDEEGAGGDPDEYQLEVPQKFNSEVTVECTATVTAVMKNCNSIVSAPVTYDVCD
jgi:hypothetical protein